MRSYLNAAVQALSIEVLTVPISMVRSVTWLFAAWLLLISPAAMAQQASISVSLQPRDNGVLFILSNDSTDTISVLRWDTPLDPELTQDVFTAIAHGTGKINNGMGNSDADNSNTTKSLNHSPARYSGRLVQRGEPTAKDFININAGDTYSALVAIGDYYQIKEQGLYTVSYLGSFEVHTGHNLVNPAPTAKTISAQSTAVTTYLIPSPIIKYAQVSGYNSCSATQQATLKQDLNASEIMTRDAHSALANLPPNERASSPRYLQWFGTYTESRYTTALDIYKKAEQVIANGSVEFDCSCNENFFAYVFPIDPYRVYLCNYYWVSAETGTDSRAGTILHELSHFPDVGATNDYAYGAQQVANLAVTRPVSAVNNADSIEYFAENSPYLEMSAGIASPPPTLYTELNLGEPISDSLAANEVLYYQVPGAEYVELTTTWGDADLLIYSNYERSNLICESTLITNVDRCDLSTTSTTYIEVLGYTASEFKLTTNKPEPAEFLNLGTVVTTVSDTAAGVCEDSGLIGDGWGWDGLATCQIPTDCIDTDGDGWGWNGAQSCAMSDNAICVDLDGDGWGWDGIQACSVSN